MRRRSIQSTSVASSSSRHLDPPTNPHPRRTLDWVPIIWHRIRALLQVLVAVVLRKFWGSVPSRPGSTSNRESAEDDHNNTSMGDLDRLPTDVFVQVLKLLGPKEAARSGLVCKSWKVLVSDNRLWVFFLTHGKHPFDTVVFAETHLRSGPMLYFDHSQQISFMHIFAERAIVPGAIIVDGGSGYCKYGWSKYAAPSGRCATFLEFGNLESPVHSRLHHFFSTIYSRMQVRASSHPIIVSVPICYSEGLYIHAVLALYAARRTSGIVVNIGFNVTSVVPILRGKVMHEVGIEVLALGALKLTGFLKELMQQRNINFQSLYTVRTIKEKLCYVASDYDAELHKDTKQSCEVASEGLFTLSKECFQTGEILFQPHIGGLHTMGLHQAVALCMNHCLAAEVGTNDGWFKTIVLAGGTSCLPGLPERLEKELHKLLPPLISEGIKVIPPPYGTDSAWFGAKIISNVSTFCDAWCITKKQFRQNPRRISGD
ncbi:hypothetical protein C4D60_Mb01t03600 [Musa balbisiana]|uniref:F-box domain-containing protein n=1 Tax=Musa balbisiana TaxID=52838 RepID=A0A4S8JJL4_MUSBA|nr:hypothetical protein C4D60_Mb01t03600 [Musa balbisiana]